VLEECVDLTTSLIGFLVNNIYIYIMKTLEEFIAEAENPLAGLNAYLAYKNSLNK